MTTIELTNSPVGATLQNSVRQNITENNSVLAGCNVHWLFRGSYTDLETGKHGVRWLIARILTEAQAQFPRATRCDNKPFENRDLYVTYGLTTEAITAKIRAVNGFDKYPDKTILDVLSGPMSDDNHVACVQRTNREDQNRNCKRPRKVWYLLGE